MASLGYGYSPIYTPMSIRFENLSSFLCEGQSSGSITRPTWVYVEGCCFHRGAENIENSQVLDDVLSKLSVFHISYCMFPPSQPFVKARDFSPERMSTETCKRKAMLRKWSVPPIHFYFSWKKKVIDHWIVFVLHC